MVKRALQSLLIYLYQLVKAMGLLGWEPTRIAVEWAYFVYKRRLEAPKLCMLQPYVRPGSHVIDVGANIGFFSCIAADWVSEPGLVIAVEPSPANLVRLKKQLIRRGLETRVEIVPAVAADRKGTRHLVINPNHPGDNRIGEHGLEVRAETLDSLIKTQNGISVSVVKLDVQGAEEIVLRGANHLLSKHHPALMVEVDDSALRDFGSSALDLARYLAGHGYSPHIIELSGTTRIDETALLSRTQDNYLDVLFLWDRDASSGTQPTRIGPQEC